MISLSFDDALDEHIDNAWPVMRSHGLCGTFYTHLAAPSLTRRTDCWRALAMDGNELGNHTIFHPADSRKEWVRPGNALDYYTLDRMRLEIEVANSWLHSIDGQAERTFAYPCCNSTLGSIGLAQKLLRRIGLQNTRLPGWSRKLHLDFGNTQHSYREVVIENNIAGRGGGLFIEGTAPPIASISKSDLPSAAVFGHSFETMAAFIERSLANDGWPILQFHGIGGGHPMDCSLNEFTKLVEWLGSKYRREVVTVLSGAKTLFATSHVTSIQQNS